MSDESDALVRDGDLSLVKATEVAKKWHALLEAEAAGGTLEGHEDAIFAMSEALAASEVDLKLVLGFIEAVVWHPATGLAMEYVDIAKEAAARLRDRQ